MKLYANRVLIPVALGINLLSACTLRSDSSYSTKMSELETAPAAEALSKTTAKTIQGTEAEGVASNETISPSAALVEDLKTTLAIEIGVPTTAILVKETTPTQWNDACLGIANPDEMCAQMVTPGYRIVLGTLTETYEFHTDQTGENFRRVKDIHTEENEPQTKPENK